MENKNYINRKSFSRFFATQILFSYFSNLQDKENILSLSSFMEQYYISDEFSNEDSELYKKSVNVDFLNNILLGTIENIDTIDQILKDNLTGKYTFNIVNDLIKVILRLAVYEFKYTSTDLKIIINEYVDISAEYFDKKAVSFVNATLDNLSKNIERNITN